MTSQLDADIPWVVFRLQDHHFAIPASVVQEMVATPDLTPVPSAPPYVRGMINLRGRVMPLIDLRQRMRMESSAEAMERFVEMLDQREQEHKNWLAELENSVRDKRKFTLTTDPHKCAFGQWFDSFETDNFELMGIIQKFDRPHRRIHAIAQEVEQDVDGGRVDHAYGMIQRTRDGALARMVELFSEVRQAVKKTRREIAMVMERGGRDVALAVDAVESVEMIDPATIEAAHESITGAADQFVTQVGRRAENDQMVLILDLTSVLDEGARLVAGAGAGR